MCELLLLGLELNFANHALLNSQKVKVCLMVKSVLGNTMHSRVLKALRSHVFPLKKCLRF